MITDNSVLSENILERNIISELANRANLTKTYGINKLLLQR